MDKPIGAYMKEFEDLGLQVLKEGEGVLLVSVPPRASNGMISEELVTKFTEVLNMHVTGGRMKNGAIQVQRKQSETVLTKQEFCSRLLGIRTYLRTMNLGGSDEC